MESFFFAFGSKGTTDNNQATSESKKCPFCAELIKKEALICRFCGQKFEPSKSIVEQKGIELTADNFLNAVRNNDKELVELFINDGIDINSCDKYGITALMLAVEKNHIDIIQILIANNAAVWRHKRASVHKRLYHYIVRRGYWDRS